MARHKAPATAAADRETSETLIGVTRSERVKTQWEENRYSIIATQKIHFVLCVIVEVIQNHVTGQIIN